VIAEIRTEKKQTQSKVFIVDDHPIVRQGLKLLINQEPDLTVCGEAENADAVLPAIRELKPAIAVIDLSLGHDSGIELIKNIKLQHPDLPILVLSMHDESLYAERALRAGARGYIMKQAAPEKVIIAIRQVLQGAIYLSDAMSAKMLNKIIDSRREATSSPMELLSDRERLVLTRHFFREEPLKVIGEHLGVTESRVCQIVGAAVTRLRGFLAEHLGLELRARCA